MKTRRLILFLFLGGWVLSASAQSNYEPYTFTTFAGVADSADGPGTAARFHYPQGVATDSAGNIYVADELNHTIRKITPDGFVTTFVGSPGDIGNADGMGSNARFYYPEGVTVGGMGNLYVSGESQTIRKITPAGVVSTLAGLAGSSGSADGIGSQARFYNPADLAADNAEYVYVADTYNHTIRKIDPTGLVTTLAGSAGITGSADGPGNVAQFNYPRGMAVDGAGNVYVADSDNSTIRKINPAGVVSTLAGLAGSPGSADGVGSAARFSYPRGVAADGIGNLYIADTGNYTIRKITPAGVVSTFAGLAGTFGNVDGIGSAARFRNPGDVTVDGSGNAYVTDNNTIRKITSDGTVITFAGIAANASEYANGPGSMARFHYPTKVAADSTRNVYVADMDNHVIRKITPTAMVSTLAGSRFGSFSGTIDGMGSAAAFSYPQGVAVDNTGNVFVADTGASTIRKITRCGFVSTFAGLRYGIGSNDGTGSNARFNGPAALAGDGEGNVYVADTQNHTIRKITSGAVVTTLAGFAGSPGSADGTGSNARFRYPLGVAADDGGNVYVADSENHTIRKITPEGVVTTLAGLAGNAGSVDGNGNVARFNKPAGVAVDASGNVFVAERVNNIIRKITATGAVTTLAGVPGFNGSLASVDGTGSAARFVSPWGIAVDNIGNVYVAESSKSIIRIGRLPSPRAKLSQLSLSAASLTPAFSPSRTSYIISVPSSTAATNVTATTPDAVTTVTINGFPATSGAPFGPIALNPGANFITVVVSAEGQTKPYTVQINRAPLVSSLNDDGADSLRQALCDAASGDTITFDIGSVTNAPALPAIITLTSGELFITNSISISGPGGKLVAIERDPAAAPFRIFNANPETTVKIEGITIEGGKAASGAGILNDHSNLTVNDCAFTHNSAGGGGAIYNNSGPAGTVSLAINRCTFNENNAENNGGAVVNEGISGYATLTINNSSFSENTAGNAGGAIQNDGGTLYLANSTLSENVAQYGDCLYNYGGTNTIGNSILERGTDGVNITDYYHNTVSAGYNVCDDDGSGFLTAASDRINTDPVLGPLKDNGGPTLTHTPLINSPAIDKGKRDTIPELATDFDQRGSVRPVDDPSVANAAGGDASDVGAVEIGVGVHPIAAASWKSHGDAGSFPINLPLTGIPGIECRSGGPIGDYQLIVTFSEPITFSNAAVTSGIGHVSGASLISDSHSRHPNRAEGASGTQVAIDLAGVTNAQVITVALFDVADGTHSGDVGIRMAVLIGDTTTDSSVNSSDVSRVKSQSGGTVTAANFRADVTANGSIDASDIALTKSESGTALP